MSDSAVTLTLSGEMLTMCKPAPAPPEQMLATITSVSLHLVNSDLRLKACATHLTSSVPSVVTDRSLVN